MACNTFCESFHTENSRADLESHLRLLKFLCPFFQLTCQSQAKTTEELAAALKDLPNEQLARQLRQISHVSHGQNS